jgi:hypothetical protein
VYSELKAKRTNEYIGIVKLWNFDRSLIPDAPEPVSMDLAERFKLRLRELSDAYTEAKLTHLAATKKLEQIDRERAGVATVLREAEQRITEASDAMLKHMSVAELPEEPYYTPK